ncbi:gene transfer agent family protein [Mesorhizobium sp. M2D.F.Ca.ET.225.01.1.1]|uniref:gene transfer agent family protein n=1 Tax=unclassified Mesorhizobium TaxID=325217 RepID=UPI000FD5F671|nr:MULTISPECIES: gene transfer agent family protein [unclassified Mesorhizobium]TGP65452.1 gene transfer agent family protein [Mesorhizobium sp. M2D.F.Ca.ET.226.01.1.1]TGP71931.1 gene transfer agent family protein [Mesorhizobium sp. M2D.F.Ca.ET.225.01.1.1]
MARGVDVTWAGGESTFLLTIDLLRALQDRCDAGPAFILERLTNGEWRVDDIISTIRLALEGGGMEKEDARKLVRRHIEEDFGVKHVLLARAILSHTLFSDEGESDAGERKAAAED